MGEETLDGRPKTDSSGAETIADTEEFQREEKIKPEVE